MTDTSNSTAATKGYVDRFETLFRHQESIAEDLAELSDEIKAAEIGPKDLAAIKKIAKLRINGKMEKAREELQALSRVADAVGMDLFAGL